MIAAFASVLARKMPAETPALLRTVRIKKNFPSFPRFQKRESLSVLV
jgi:hypothetical protein